MAGTQTVEEGSSSSWRSLWPRTACVPGVLRAGGAAAPKSSWRGWAVLAPGA